MNELLLNHTYLLKYGYYILSSVTVLNITNKAYFLRWNRGLNSVDTWEEKEYIHNKYDVIEDVSDFVQNKNCDVKYITAKTKWIQCPVCDGTGSIPNQESTSGFITCPNCFGSKMIISVSEIIE